MNDVKFMHDTRDSCATRFLRARKYDLEAALAMFNATVVRGDQRVRRRGCLLGFEISDSLAPNRLGAALQSPLR